MFVSGVSLGTMGVMQCSLYVYLLMLQIFRSISVVSTVYPGNGEINPEIEMPSLSVHSDSESS